MNKHTNKKTDTTVRNAMRAWLLIVCFLALSTGLMGAKGGRTGCIGYTYQECTPGAKQACFSGFVFNRNVGACKDGSQTCGDDGAWGPCSGDVLPKDSDDCSGEDLNCDGVAASKDNKEVCNGKDDNCDGKVDDGDDICPAGQTCEGRSGCKDGSGTSAVVVKKGNFQDGDHPTSGEGRVVKEGDKYFVELSDDFKTDAGPDLRIYLVEDAQGKVTDNNYIDAGKLTNVTGKARVEFSFPSGKTIDDYKSIVIWCNPFRVVFGFATLS